MGLMFRIVFFKILCLPSFFSTFCKELWASGVVWLHLSISFLVFFQQFLQGIKDFRCRMVTWFYLISSLFWTCLAKNSRPQLGRREPQHCAFFFGFTGSPRTSLFKFNVSIVFCTGFTTLSKLICCVHACCIWNFPCSLVAFHLPLFSTYHVAPFQLAMVLAMCFSSVKCAPFQITFAIYMFPPFAMFAPFQFAFCFPFFLHCHVFLFQVCIFQFHVFGIASPFSQDEIS